MPVNRESVREGMRVYTADGIDIGNVFKLDPEHFIITRGTWLPVDYLCNYAHVVAATEAVYLDETLEQVKAGLSVEPELQRAVEESVEPEHKRQRLLEEGFDARALSEVAEASEAQDVEGERSAPRSDEELARDSVT